MPIYRLESWDFITYLRRLPFELMEWCRAIIGMDILLGNCIFYELKTISTDINVNQTKWQMTPINNNKTIRLINGKLDTKSKKRRKGEVPCTYTEKSKQLVPWSMIFVFFFSSERSHNNNNNNRNEKEEKKTSIRRHTRLLIVMRYFFACLSHVRVYYLLW